VAADRNNTILVRQHFTISGIVQGVGFRPFLHRLAREYSLTGWVCNTPAGVELEFQGSATAMEAIAQRITGQAPPLAVIDAVVATEIPAISEESFHIIASTEGVGDVQIAPDSALCDDCLRELFDPADRRYRYPFVTCTNCGPRYSIITDTPYDRPTTTMSGFPLCPQCKQEYHDPINRRFHAQPLACPVCGPQISLLDQTGHCYADHGEAISRSVELLTNGAILAVKGIGGYHLVVDAANSAAVKRLRVRKERDEKPFAVMALDLAAARRICDFDSLEERLLASPESPIVILRKSPDCPLAMEVAPGNGWLGVMLPYTPIHHLLLRGSAFSALVMTSANKSDEPIVYENAEARRHLSGIADYYLTHNRPIHTRCDDSVIRVFQGKPLFYRRSRGYVPRSIRLPFHSDPLLAVGSEMKNTFCYANGNKAFLSQHIGDLKNDAICDSFCRSIDHFGTLLRISPESIACDQHPDYLSSVYAAESGLSITTVQHHHAHLAACMAENGLLDDAIGLIYDGTGFGSDGTVWGGEILVGGYAGFERAGHFRQVPLPGGDVAVREPWRMALSYLFAALGSTALTHEHQVCSYLSPADRDVFTTMLERRINSPLTSSCGRLFDAVAALLTTRHSVSYDGQAAIELEALAEESTERELQPFEYAISPGPPLQIDFLQMFPAILISLRDGVPPAIIARRVHETVAQASVQACLMVADTTGIRQVVLSGGVFQNRLLTDMVYTDLTKSGLQVFTHRLTPPNDGCIALGQAAIAGWKTRRSD
jgi:hydrogenase maturation protein HypF